MSIEPSPSLPRSFPGVTASVSSCPIFVFYVVSQQKLLSSEQKKKGQHAEWWGVKTVAASKEKAGPQKQGIPKSAVYQASPKKRYGGGERTPLLPSVPIRRVTPRVRVTNLSAEPRQLALQQQPSGSQDSAFEHAHRLRVVVVRCGRHVCLWACLPEIPCLTVCTKACVSRFLSETARRKHRFDTFT